ncbi:MAG: nucleotidyltransferase domain-containing protein [bacterium]|nr:nucleotidyltransferase domain-containing protein [bacterium]
MKTINTIKNDEFLNILSDVKEEVINLFGDSLRQLILFGSYARNQQDPESDIDIMILAEESEDELRKNRPMVVDIMAELSMKHEKLISLTQVPYTRYNEYLDVLPFYRNVYDEGVEIYGKKTA